jgi:hypothetical protein
MQVSELMGSLDVEASLPTTLRHHALLPQLAVGDNRGMVRVPGHDVPCLVWLLRVIR